MQCNGGRVPLTFFFGLPFCHSVLELHWFADSAALRPFSERPKLQTSIESAIFPKLPDGLDHQEVKKRLESCPWSKSILPS